MKILIARTHLHPLHCVMTPEVPRSPTNFFGPDESTLSNPTDCPRLPRMTDVRDTTRSISDLSQSCRQRLEACVALPALAAHKDSFRVRLADFNLWTSGSGALAKKRLSLDTRLADEPNAHAVILNLLSLMVTLLAKCQLQQQQDGPTPSPECHDTLDRIRRLITYLVRISIAIRRSGAQARLEQADGEFREHRHGELKRFLAFVVAANALGTRYKEADVENDPIINRLIRANLRRRHRFLYYRRRAIKQLASTIDMSARVKSVAWAFGSIQRNNPKETKGSAHGSMPAVVDTISKPETQRPPATPPSFVASSSALTPLREPVGLPEGSQASSIAATATISKVVYPRAPRVPEGQDTFTCPCCWQPLHIGSSKGSHWK